MPELPEVETVRRQLTEKVIGKEITGVEVWHQKTIAFDVQFVDRLLGKTISHIDRVGKLLIFSFADEDDLFLLAHLKMTGQFFYVGKKGDIIGGGHLVSETDVVAFPGRHTRSAFYFKDDSALYFNDMRLFGYTKLANAATVVTAREGFGPEPIDPEFDVAWFVDRLRKRNAPIKAVLLDQAFVSGLGNIYVDEALWRARVRPGRKASRVTRLEAAAIAAAARDVMLESIEAGGTTFQHFVDTKGDTGNFTEHLKVFGKQDTPCPRCGTTIKKVRLAGRGTHFCPGCQK